VTQFLPLGVVSAPASWVLPSSLELQVEAVFAHYDGSGAAAPFTPALKVISSAGEVVGIYPTPTPIAAAGSADVSWFPRVSGGGTPLPGQVLQTYDGAAAAADFNFNSTVLIQSNYPNNPTLTKQSGTSFLLMIANMDINPGGAPNVISVAVYIDAIKQENWFHHQSVNNTIITVHGSKVQGLNLVTDPPFSAGNHTVSVWVQSVSGANCTLLSSFACDMQIIEYESAEAA